MTYYEHMRAAAREYWARVLQAHPRSGDAAQAAGVNRTHFYHLLRQAGLRRGFKQKTISTEHRLATQWLSRAPPPTRSDPV